MARRKADPLPRAGGVAALITMVSNGIGSPLKLPAPFSRANQLSLMRIK